MVETIPDGVWEIIALVIHHALDIIATEGSKGTKVVVDLREIVIFIRMDVLSCTHLLNDSQYR